MVELVVDGRVDPTLEPHPQVRAADLESSDLELSGLEQLYLGDLAVGIKTREMGRDSL